MNNIRNTDTLEIGYQGVDITVEFMHYPGEDAVMYYPDGSGYPGCGEEIEIDSISIKGVDIYDLLSTKQIGEITDELSKAINN